MLPTFVSHNRTAGVTKLSTTLISMAGNLAGLSIHLIYGFKKTEVTKKERQMVFEKYAGRCAYCGCALSKGWHVDHLKPIRRKKYKKDECRYPQRDCLENYMPACASCNINKHAMKLEDFRALVAGFMKHLNERNTQYKIAKRYGLVIEDQKPVIFYFERYVPQPNNADQHLELPVANVLLLGELAEQCR